MNWVGTTCGHTTDGIRDVMLAAVENRFGNALKAPAEIEWLTDNGWGYTADKIRSFASSIGLKPLATPVCSPFRPFSLAKIKSVSTRHTCEKKARAVRAQSASASITHRSR
jgi:transposase InsO family protein